MFASQDMSQDFQPHYLELKSEIEAALKAAVDRSDWPDSLREAVEYSLLAGGKRLRPALVAVACEICGGSGRKAMPAACAIEMIHTYSLIHDDLPAMDDDDLRRGRPTSHKVFGEALAILAGDALLTLAFESISRLEASPAAIAECTRILASAAGASGMVGGQVLDLEAERGSLKLSETPGNTSVSSKRRDANTASADSGRDDSESAKASIADPAIRVEELVRIHRMKTGALISAALQMGVAVADGNDEQRERLIKYGQAIGLAFQIADDLLDVTGTNERLGKETGRDDELGKLTFPSLIGVEESRTRASDLIDEAVDALSIFDHAADPLRQLARFIIERDH